jgi:dihydrofolate reductase
MTRVRVHNLAISLDGYGSGEPQSFEEPFGHGAHIMDWFKATRTFHAMIGDPQGGETGVDDDFAGRWGPGIGVEIMGRSKYAPGTGGWPDDWHGWWGDEPPFRTPCIVLTHHPREPLEMAGGTTFHFLDADPEAALARARELAPGTDVRLGGGVTTVRSFLEADLVDYLHLVVSPVVLGRGSLLWGERLDGLERRFDDVRVTPSPSGVTHVEFERA